MFRITLSILSADFSRVGQDVKTVDESWIEINPGTAIESDNEFIKKYILGCIKIYFDTAFFHSFIT